MPILGLDMAFIAGILWSCLGRSLGPSEDAQVDEGVNAEMVSTTPAREVSCSWTL